MTMMTMTTSRALCEECGGNFCVSDSVSLAPLLAGMTHIFLGVIFLGSVFQYLNMYMNYHDNFSEFKQTSQYKTEFKRLSAEMKVRLHKLKSKSGLP
jgi:hypothetical protein